MIRPWIAPREIKIDLPNVIVDSLGSGAEVLASYLTQLAESGLDEPEQLEPPPPVLCRICERQIPRWWFEKHTELCLQEHRAEMDVQMAQENLTEHRHSIVRVLDALEARKSRSLAGDQTPVPVAEYKGLPIGPPPSTQSSPGSSLPRSRERSGGLGHTRARSFAIRLLPWSHVLGGCIVAVGNRACAYEMWSVVRGSWFLTVFDFPLPESVDRDLTHARLLGGRVEGLLANPVESQ